MNTTTAKLPKTDLSITLQQCFWHVSAATKRWKWWKRCGERLDFPFADRESVCMFGDLYHMLAICRNRFFWTYTALHEPIRASQKEPLRNTKFFFVDSTQKKGNHPKQQDNPAPKDSNRAPKTADISNTNNTSSILKCHPPGWSFHLFLCWDYGGHFLRRRHDSQSAPQKIERWDLKK